MDQDLIRLQDHLAVLRRRWRLVVVCLILAIGASLALSLSQTKMYQGTASLLLQPEQPVDTGGGGAVMEPEEVATQADVIASVQVAERVVDELNLDAEEPQDLLDDISVTVVEDKRVVEVSALEPRPQLAADIANAFAEQYIEYREEEALEAAEAEEERYTEAIEDVQDDLRRVRRQMDDSGVSGDELDALQQQESSLIFQQSQIAAQLSAAQAVQAGPLPGGEVLLRAEPSRQPAEPKPIQAGVLGGVIGLLIGVGLAYVRDRLDDAIRDEQRLRSAVSGRPILGSIPASGDESTGRVATLLAPQSPLSEAYRTLNTNVRFLLAAEREHRPGRGDVLLVTSAGPGEGKTSVATNLAVAASRVGLRVILVDADLRRPAAADKFGLDVPVGLSDLLADGGPPNPHLHEVGLGRLRVLAAGSIPPNPAELLASPRIAGLLAELADQADLVVVDSAPVLRVADSLELIDAMDLILLVARRKVSRIHSVSAAADRIRQVGGTLSGCVFNGVDTKASSYGYGYPSRTESKPRTSRRQRRRQERQAAEEARIGAGLDRGSSG